MSDTLTKKDTLKMVQDQGEALLNAIAHIASGNTDVEIEIPEGIDVMSNLAIAISFLAEDVADRIRVQNELLDQLELRVQERTRELELAVEALEKSQKKYLRDEWDKYLRQPNNEFQDVDWGQSNHFKPAIEKTVLEKTSALAPINGNGSSALTVPINLADDLIGMLGFEGEELESLSEDDLSAIEDIAEQVGLALENQRLFNQTQQALAETQEQYEISARLNSAESPREILDSIVDSLKTSDVDFVTLWSIYGHPGKDDIYNDAYMQKEESWSSDADFHGYPVGYKARFSEALFFTQIAETRKNIFVESIHDDPQITFDTDMVVGLQQIGVNSFACLTLVVGSRLIGLLTLSWKKAQTFTDRDISKFTSIGTQMSTSVDGLRLLGQTRLALAETQDLYEISAQLNAAESTRDIISTVVDNLADSNLDSARLWFTDQTDSQSNWIQIVEVWNKDSDQTPYGPGFRFDYSQSPYFVDLLNKNRQNALIESVTDDPIMQKDKILMEGAKATGLNSIVYMPLLASNRLVGLLALGWKTPQMFDGNDRQRFAAVGTQIAAAVDSIKLLDRTQRALSDTQDLYEFSAELNAAESSTDIVQAVVNAMEKSGIDSARLWFTESTAASNRWIQIAESWTRIVEETPRDPGSRFEFVNSPFLRTLLREDKQNALITDVKNDDRLKKDKVLLDRLASIGLNSAAYLPLVIGQRLVGLVVIGWKKPRTFDASDIQRFTAFAAQIATAVDSLQLLDQTRLALTETQTLYQISTQLNASESAQDIMLAVVNSIEEMNIDGARLWRVERLHNGELWLEMLGNWNKDPEDDPYGIGYRFDAAANPFLLDLLTDSRETTLISSLKTDPRTKDNQDLIDRVEPTGLNSFVYLPLVIGFRLIGLFVISWKEIRVFKEGDNQRFGAIGAQVATAIDSLQLLDQTQEALAETQTLYQISALLNAAESTNDIVSAIAVTIADQEISEAILWRVDSLAGGNQQLVMIDRWPMLEDVDTSDQLTAYDLSDYPFLTNLLNDAREVTMVSSFLNDPRTASDENFVTLMSDVGNQSMIFLPLQIGNRLVGLLTLGWHEVMDFDENDSQRYTAIGAQIATSLDSLRLLDQTQEALNETQALYQISARLNAAESASEIVQSVVDTIQGREVDGARLWLAHNVQSGQWEIENAHSWFKNKNQDQMQVGNRINLADLPYVFELLLDSRDIRLVDSIQDDPRIIKHPALLESLSQSGYASMAFIPLYVGSKLVGLFTFGWNEKRAFTDLEHQYFTAIGAQIATSVEGLRLLEDARLRATQLEKLTEVETALSAAADENEILTIISEVFPSARGGLHYLDQDEAGELTFIDTVAVFENNELWDQDRLPPEPVPVVNFIGNEFWTKRPRSYTMISNTLESENFDDTSKEIAERMKAFSFCVLPLVVGRRWQGIIHLAWAELYELSATESFLLDNLREPLGAIVARHRSQIAALEARQETEQLYGASSQLNQAASDLENIVQVVAEFAQPIGISQTVLAFTRLDRNGEPVGLEVSAVHSEASLENSVQVGNRFGRSAHEQISTFEGAVFIENVEEESGLTTGTKRLFDQLASPAAGILPLNVGDREVGFVFLLSDEPMAFDEKSRRLFSSLAPQIAVAVQNSIFLSDAQTRANREQMLRQISEKVRNTADVESVMRTAVTEIGRVLGRKTFLYLKSNDDDTGAI